MLDDLTPQQKLAAYATASVVVEAGAGTGKTHLLTARVLHYLQTRNFSPLEIVAVTFTEKAAEELRSRIRSAIKVQMPDRRDILAELEAAQISTIHALASRICAEFSELAGIPANFTVLESSQGKIWLANALEQAIAELPNQYFKVLPYSLMKQALKALLDDPYTAERALQQGIGDWQKLIEQQRAHALTELVSSPAWQEAQEILQTNTGAAEDKLEIVRQQVIEAIADFEQGNIDNEIITCLEKAKTNVGSQKNWNDITLVRNALKIVKNKIKELNKTGSLTSELTEADKRLEQIIPAIAEAYSEVTTKLDRLKQQARVLTFSDLEIFALKALENPQVREYYQQRWQIFLVDEFQDTNPTQAELLRALTQKAELTIVGDIKQSIYGFRRADIQVFRDFKQQILQQQGTEVVLNQSFRTHAKLINQINAVFQPLLGEMHQDLQAFRETAFNDGQEQVAKSYIECFTIAENKELIPPERHQLEAAEIAKRIQTALDNKLPVHDKKTQTYRPIEPGDFLIITRTWQPLETYGQAIAKLGIPIAPAGGGNLLATREAKDCWALLRFLSDPSDDIALVAVLRSPWFTISDRTLLELALVRKPQDSQNKNPQSKDLPNWWLTIQNSNKPVLNNAVSILKELLAQRTQNPPSWLLQKSDRATGYSAIINNLSQGKRRLADWQGFRELIKELETGTQDIFGVVRDLKQLYENNATIPRLPLEIGNAVGLMTIYAAKGLERACVIVADLSKQKPPQSPVIYCDRELGIAIKSKDTQNNYQKPWLYSYLENQHKQKQQAEDIRVMYVALTRARDYLLLTASQPDKNDLKLLTPGLANVGVTIETITSSINSLLNFPDSEDCQRVSISNQTPEPQLLTNSVGSGIFELPVTSLTEYARCPQRFWWQYLQGHPGAGEGTAYGMEIGSLVHKALELNLKDKTHLMPFCQNDWQGETVTEALELVDNFLKSNVYKIYRDTAIAKEQALSLQIGSISFSGIADLIGEDWLMDYKSDRVVAPLEHRFQIWAYAKALEFEQAHIAYLRHDQVYSFNSQQLQAIETEAHELVKQIESANYQATPSETNCAICNYSSICEHAW